MTNISFDQIYIADLTLSTRCRNCLYREDIRTIADIRRVGVRGLQDIRNLGKKSIAEIRAALRQHGTDLPEYGTYDCGDAKASELTMASVERELARVGVALRLAVHHFRMLDADEKCFEFEQY